MNGGAVGRTATAGLAFSLALRLRAKVLLAAGSRPPRSKSPIAPPPSGGELDTRRASCTLKAQRPHGAGVGTAFDFFAGGHAASLEDV